MELEILITLIIAVLAYFVGMFAGFKSIWSPIGMLVVTLCCTFMITPTFQEIELAGWVMVGFSVFYLIMTLRAYQLYNRFNKKENYDG